MKSRTSTFNSKQNLSKNKPKITNKVTKRDQKNKNLSPQQTKRRKLIVIKGDSTV